MTSFGRQFDFNGVNYHIQTIDGVTSFLQLMDVQNVRKKRVLVQTRVTGNSNTLFKMAESL